MYLSRWVIATFCLLYPLLWQMERKRLERKVIVWSDSHRVVLMRSMVEQTVSTVFTNDGEGVTYRAYTEFL